MDVTCRCCSLQTSDYNKESSQCGASVEESKTEDTVEEISMENKILDSIDDKSRVSLYIFLAIHPKKVLSYTVYSAKIAKCCDSWLYAFYSFIVSSLCFIHANISDSSFIAFGLFVCTCMLHLVCSCSGLRYWIILFLHCIFPYVVKLSFPFSS